HRVHQGDVEGDAPVGVTGQVDHPRRPRQVEDVPATERLQLRDAQVVGVTVGQQDGGDVLQGAAHRVELREQVPPQPGQTGVDDGDPAALLDEVDGHQVRAGPVQARRDAHHGPLSPGVPVGPSLVPAGATGTRLRL